MGRRIRILAVSIAMLMAMLGSVAASANQHIVISDQDCQSIVQAGAAAPKTVPADVVAACEEFLALAPAAGAPAAASPADPCSGPNAGASVYCWGPWTALASAAGGAAAPTIIYLYDEDLRPELASVFDPELDLPLDSCTPGGSCGFATIVVNGTVTSIENFDMAPDGSSFVVAPGQANEIQSATDMTTVFIVRPDQFENMLSVSNDPNQTSLLIARVLRPNGTDIETAADIWAYASNGTVNQGTFAWGQATSQADLNALNSGAGATVSFAGFMSGDAATAANLSLNFGAAPTWSGNWTNPGYNFSAGGDIIGADFVSDSSLFSGNVDSGFVQGAILGPVGDQAVTHAVDVTLQGVGNVRDVGLLVQQP